MISFANVDDIALDRELGAKSLRSYLEMAWPWIEPARPFMPNYHHDAICDHLEAVTNLEILRLVINVPPGTTKSILCSVVWPTWSWARDPSEKWITASYSDRIARRDALRARHLLETRWYQDRWGSTWKKDPDDWSASSYRNDRAGFRFAVTVGGSATGEHADRQLVDDPIKPLDARGARVDSTKLEVCREWWDETMATRVVDPATATRVIIMQRLHEADLSGHVLDSGSYVHLNLPMRYEPRCAVTIPHACSLRETGKGEPSRPTPTGYKDPRQEGELLWPERFPESVLETRKEELGSRGVAAQDQQRPMPAGGGVFQRDWLQYWLAQPKGRGVQLIQSWDCAFKGLTDSDHVVGQVWARRGGEYFLLDQIRDRMSFSATCKAIVAMSAKWPKATRKLIEDKANGSAVINLLQKKIPGLIPINPEGGKVSRAHAVEPIWESGNVWIPDPSLARWVSDFVEEIVTFNGDPGRADDQVDAMTQALVYLYKNSVDRYAQAMRAIR